MTAGLSIFAEGEPEKEDFGPLASDGELVEGASRPKGLPAAAPNPEPNEGLYCL